MKKLSNTKIQEAKALLKEAGYFTDNLWHIDDVKTKVKHIPEDDAQEVLDMALTNEFVMESVHQAITFEIRKMNLTLKYDE